MLVSLTPTQLQALGSPAANLLADIVREAFPGQDREIAAPGTNRRAFGAALRTLAEAGIVAVAEPGSWSRAGYTVRLATAEDAHWCQSVGALDRWPRLYPEIWDHLRSERADLDPATFRQRICNGVLTALSEEVSPAALVTWLGNALNRPAPARLPDPKPKTPGEPSAETPIPRAQLRAMMADPDYVREAFLLPEEGTDGN